MCLLALQSSFLVLFQTNSGMASSSPLHQLALALSETGTCLQVDSACLQSCSSSVFFFSTWSQLPSLHPSLLLKTNQPREPASSPACLLPYVCHSLSSGGALLGVRRGVGALHSRIIPALGCHVWEQSLPLDGGSILDHSLQVGTASDLSPS